MSESDGEAAARSTAVGAPTRPAARSHTCLPIAACLCALLLTACYESLMLTTWPLFMHTHFGWSEQEYAPLLFARVLALGCGLRGLACRCMLDRLA